MGTPVEEQRAGAQAAPADGAGAGAAGVADAGDGSRLHDALDTLQGIANAMVDPFDLAPSAEGGSGVLEGARGAAGGGGGGESDAEDHDYDKVDIGELFPPSSGRCLAVPLPPLSPGAILLRDKLAFVLGLTLTWCMAYWLGWSPSTFYKLYSGLTVLLGLIRWVSYRSKRWHYYMLDFCYFANLLLLAHCWLAPRSALLSKITFAFNTGPLSWSILAFRNSLVLHSLDKVTSVYMHIAPALVSWTLRWKPDAERFGPPPGSPGAAGGGGGAGGEAAAWPGAAGFSDLVLLPIPIYVLWAVAYYLKIFVISAERIRLRGYATLFTYVANTEKKGVYAAIARCVTPALRPPVYLLLHLLFCCVTMSVSIAAWRSFAAHTLLVGAICVTACWHGACYYFEFFSRRYLADLERRACAAAGGGGGGKRGAKSE
ncbi:MAG: hypothetical protein J3K34DRAFT_63001 [Monoraphidium minutum]|nr:MAG: hypothetical protein J3K34DRAFT_63001 [Monoraphidium minutum]